MRLPGHDDDDNEFYDRAAENYPDHDPARPRRTTTWAGPVLVWPPDITDTSRFEDPYTQEEVNDVVKQGRDRPRPLTHEQTELVNKNRREARADLAAMEQWYRAECRDNNQKRTMLRRYPTGTANYGHEPRKSDDSSLRGIDFGDQFWQPVIW